MTAPNATPPPHAGQCYAHSAGRAGCAKVTDAQTNKEYADHGESLKWITKAAAQHHLAALIKLAAMHMEGKVVSKNFTAAEMLLQSAAEQGDTSSQYTLAVLYDEGIRIPQDTEQARAWYLKAAAAGDDADAIYGVGLFQQRHPDGTAPSLGDHQQTLAKAAGEEGTAERMEESARNQEKEPTQKETAEGGILQAILAMYTRLVSGGPAGAVGDDGGDSTRGTGADTVVTRTAAEWIELAARDGHDVAARLASVGRASDSSDECNTDRLPAEEGAEGKAAPEETAPAEKTSHAANGHEQNERGGRDGGDAGDSDGADAGEAAVSDAEAERLASWVLEAGGTINGVSYAAVGAGGGRGIVATRALRKGELLISVPSSLWFSTTNIMERSAASHIFRDPKVVLHCGPPEAGDLWMLILALEAERFQAASPCTSCMVPYVVKGSLRREGFPTS